MGFNFDRLGSVYDYSVSNMDLCILSYVYGKISVFNDPKVIFVDTTVITYAF